MTRDADVIVIGAGAVGTSTARALGFQGYEVVVCEKEPGPGLHQSGRNSGVVHVGYQYEPGTLKARFATEGAERLKAYCRQHGIPLEEGGLLVVARNTEEVNRLGAIADRAKANGVEARLVDDDGLQEIEPHAAGQAGLHVPAYASFDARAYVHALTAEAMNQGVRFYYDRRVTAIQQDADEVVIGTDKGQLTARAVVNAAGLFSDRLAGQLCTDMRIVPFRGYYAELAPRRRELVASHIYPTPDPQLPFLGVHLSRRADGRVIVGPGAMLAFGREAYRFHQFKLRDLWSTFTWPGFYRLMADPKMRRMIPSEVHKSLSLKAIWREAQQLCPALQPGDLVRSFAGNRAQMVTRDGELVMDLVVREQDRAVHVLNAISPGLTCSLPFGEHLAEKVAARCEP